ncbi:transcriptional activator RfaH [Emcibacter sp. SYSU 3D8]|uniref:transcription termination/antitermination protein NusG n=1 Tax=Emcibacter sp. SYSU 3D8 TaxID=3133969 RepID=UPI0031FED732
MTANGQARWYVAQTLPRKEALALANLTNQNFTTFCPRIRCTRRHARKFYTVKEPLFPGYLFVSIDTGDQPWRSINGTRGVVRLLTDAAGPVPLHHHLIDELMATATGDALADLAPGQEVKLRTGPFADFIGRVVSLSANHRAKVLLHLMNREVTVETAIQDIDVMGQAT